MPGGSGPLQQKCLQPFPPRPPPKSTTYEAGGSRRYYAPMGRNVQDMVSMLRSVILCGVALERRWCYSAFIRKGLVTRDILNSRSVLVTYCIAFTHLIIYFQVVLYFFLSFIQLYLEPTVFIFPAVEDSE